MHIEDTGSGIPPGDAGRTSGSPSSRRRRPERAPGLGLSTVRGIVENHKGFLTLKTQEGKGTTFRVYFPAEESASAKGSSGSAHPFIARGNGELILIVDDEVQIRDVIATTLARYGYRVLIARDGTEALALFSTRSAEVAVVVTDLSMPNLDGAALANVIHQMNPSVKILVMSGLNSGARNPQMQRFAGAFMAKPFKAQTLLSTVSGLLHPGDQAQAR
jgi:two-component system, cell cycle sensor histidine kinase and response regulator CckA